MGVTKKEIFKAVGRSRGCSGDHDHGMYVARNNNDLSYKEAWG